MQTSFLVRTCAVCFALAGTGCSSPVLKEPIETIKNIGKSKSQQELDSGIKSYEEGDYKAAVKQLQNSLDLGLESKSDQADAHKYLAFVYCTSGKEKNCREEFRKALDSDPKFDLQPAETGHPLWGPVFRSVKTEVNAKTKVK